MTCGGGIERQIKTCTSPIPKHGGKQCPGSQPSRNVRSPRDVNAQAISFLAVMEGNVLIGDGVVMETMTVATGQMSPIVTGKRVLDQHHEERIVLVWILA